MKTLVRALAISAALVLAACGTTSSVTPTATDTPDVEPELINVHHDVSFYPACGNETVEIEGVRWYQLRWDEEPTHPLGWGPNGRLPEPDGMGMSRGTSSVVAPGPGDDVGTVYVFEGGRAFFESDSGDLKAWLTSEVREYDWVC